MSIHPGHLREYIIRPVLKHLNAYSEAAEELLMLTAATESECGRYLHQIGGPALGVWQMEPATYHDIYKNYLIYNPILRTAVNSFGSNVKEIPGNLYYACAMTRCHYLRVPEGLPSAMDIDGLAEYWKAHYNTYKGSGVASEAIDKYHKYAVVD